MPETKKYTWIHVFFTCIVAVSIGCGIYYGGKFISKEAFNYDKRQIDKHGLLIKAEVSNKRQLKGWYIYFNYIFKDRPYSEREMNMDYYEKVEIGDVIDIKIDTTDPKEAYIITHETPEK